MARSDLARLGLRKIVPFARRVPAGKEAGCRSRYHFQVGLGTTPIGGDDLADGKSGLGVIDRRREQLGPGPGSKSPSELVPAINTSGDRPAQRSVGGNRGQSLGFEQVNRSGGGSAAARV